MNWNNFDMIRMRNKKKWDGKKEQNNDLVLSLNVNLNDCCVFNSWERHSRIATLTKWFSATRCIVMCIAAITSVCVFSLWLWICLFSFVNKLYRFNWIALKSRWIWVILVCGNCSAVACIPVGVIVDQMDFFSVLH